MSLAELLQSNYRNGDIHIIDGFPIAICHLQRPSRCVRFKGEADYGYCAAKREHYYGFKGHLLINGNGEISGFSLTEANVSERDVVYDFADNIDGLLLGDKGYLGEELKEKLYKSHDIELETPVRKNMNDYLSKENRTLLNKIRRKIETIIGQLVERFNIQKVWARSKSSLFNRIIRKLLSHGLCTLLNKQNGRPASKLAEIIA